MLVQSPYGTPDFIIYPEASRAWLEARRWSDGPVCPYCGFAKAYTNKARPGFYRCARPRCRKDFTVLSGTLMERSHIPIDKWLAALWLAAGSRKKLKAEDLQRELAIGYKSAWYLADRLVDVKQRARLAARPKGQRRKVRPAQPVSPDDTDQPVRPAITTGIWKPKLR